MKRIVDFARWGLVVISCIATGCSLYFNDDPDQDPGEQAPPDDPNIPCWEAFKCSPPPPPDAQPPPQPFLSPEGGGFRIERIEAGEADVRIAAQALFFEGQAPAFRELAGPPLAEEPSFGGMMCFDYRAGIFFANGPTRVGQEIADTRAYFDAGSTVSLTSEQTGTELVLDKMPPGALDPSQLLQHDISYAGAPDASIDQNAFYLPRITGSIAYSAFDLRHGESAIGVDLTEAPPRLFVPPGFTLTQPEEVGFFSEPVTFTRGFRFTFLWENHAAPAPEAGGVLPFVRFSTELDELEVMCIMPEDTGALQVPTRVFEVIAPTGKILVGKLSHAAWILTRDRTRVDLIGVNGKVNEYVVADPPAP